MEREVSDIRSSSSSAGGTSSSSSAASSSSVVVVAGDETAAAAEEKKYRCCICNKAFRTDKALCGHMRSHPSRSWRGVKPPPTAAAPAEEHQGRRDDVRDSDAAEGSSIPVRKSSVLIDQRAEAEDVNPRRMESVVNQLLFLVESQGDVGGSSENTASREVFSVAAAEAEAGAEEGAAAGPIVAADNGTVLSGVKKGTSSSSSSAAGGSGAHTCGKCGKTFATGQSLGGHMRKHYDGPPIMMKNNNKRARELQAEETPAATVERKVRMDMSSFSGPLESHNPAALPSRSVQASDGSDCGRDREEPGRSSAGNGARRLHNFFPNEPAEPEEEPKNAQRPEPEGKDDDGDDDELLSLQLGRRWSGV